MQINRAKALHSSRYNILLYSVKQLTLQHKEQARKTLIAGISCPQAILKGVYPFLKTGHTE
ncbi:hypothetical protein SAMN05216326_11145 [Nitrosomonas marina]|uniref:Uncharacterized protein n=1 Tax=Nitrosomonas marina TaxID=917 RepID=A0A1I0BLI2_9PROT|nr:hypothetical protein SAMN05216326_11145 [Nitrosomonas marina]